LPVVAPFGTVVPISVAETTVNVAAVPLNVRPVAPVKSVPRILTVAPTLPEVGRVLTNGPRPTEMLKTVPSLLAPPKLVVVASRLPKIRGRQTAIVYLHGRTARLTAARP
jgi:hypothetical protein